MVQCFCKQLSITGEVLAVCLANRSMLHFGMCNHNFFLLDLVVTLHLYLTRVTTRDAPEWIK
jgi:hypothetical protein